MTTRTHTRSLLGSIPEHEQTIDNYMLGRTVGKVGAHYRGCCLGIRVSMTSVYNLLRLFDTRFEVPMLRVC